MMRRRSLVCVTIAVAAVGPPLLAQPADGRGYLEFDGVDDVVAAEGDFLSPSMTVEAWVRPTKLDPLYTAGVVTYGSQTRSSFDFGIGQASDPRLRFFINYGQGQSTIVGTQPVAMGEWQHLAATYDGHTARLYINGELDAERVLGAAILPSGPDALLTIGDDAPGASEFVGGSFDEVRLWDVARTRQEIVDSMFTPLSGDEPGLIAYYDFDECGGQAAIDRSPEGRHASLGRTPSRAGDDPKRETYAPSRIRCIELGSSDPGETRLVVGTVQEQLGQINAGPPALGWHAISSRHADLHQRGSFACDSDPGLPYVDSETFLTGDDEITLDNCSSAFYRVPFEMPPVVGAAEVFGVANASDLAVAFVNGVAISPALTAGDAGALGTDRSEDGHPLIGWPTADVFFTGPVPGLIVGGTNEIAFGVCSDADALEPAGMEFGLVVQYECLADWDADGDRDTIDFAAYLNDWSARDPLADLNGDGRVNTMDVTVWLNTWSFGCPGSP
ncbi:MAG: hypothetical protein IPJ41_01185 [Phycisphaerales bacterium]|nr:hypothetical protein [Phycisphaerales bacterium]